MEKVKLTREQAEAIEELLKLRTKESIAREKANPFSLISGYINESSRLVFKDMAFDTLIKALYIGYEVEETIKIGDWVKVNWRDKNPTIHKARRVNNAFAIIDGEQANTEPPMRIIEHATPEEITEEKQRRWWAKHGRDVWELRENDILYYDDEFKEVEEVTDICAIMLSSERVYIPLETIKSKYSVACFAEDRKDIDGGDNE